MQVRQWSFVPADQMENVMFREVQVGKSKVKVAEIGSSNGKINNCWWTNFDEKKNSDIQAIEELTPHLNAFQYPPLEKVIKARDILNSWIDNANAGKNVFFLLIYISIILSSTLNVNNSKCFHS